MTGEALWQRYFYDPHGPRTLARWARALHVFRFCRAQGGHAGDGDAFRAALRFESEPDLLVLLNALGIPATRLPADHPQPVPGQTYTGAEYAAFVHAVRAYPSVAQPGNVHLGGAPAHVWIYDASLQLSVSDADDVWSVSEAAFEAARAVETVLAPHARRVIDPPLASRNCLCPAYHPDVWAHASG